VASHLLKFCHFTTDSHGVEVELHYVLDLEKREVDFLLTWEKKPWLLVECKLEPGGSHGGLAYFGRKLDLEARYLVTYAGSKDYVDKETRVRTIPAARFLTAFV